MGSPGADSHRIPDPAGCRVRRKSDGLFGRKRIIKAAGIGRIGKDIVLVGSKNEYTGYAFHVGKHPLIQYIQSMEVTYDW